MVQNCHNLKNLVVFYANTSIVNQVKIPGPHTCQTYWDMNSAVPCAHSAGLPTGGEPLWSETRHFQYTGLIPLLVYPNQYRFELIHSRQESLPEMIILSASQSRCLLESYNLHQTSGISYFYLPCLFGYRFCMNKTYMKQREESTLSISMGHIDIQTMYLSFQYEEISFQVGIKNSLMQT